MLIGPYNIEEGDGKIIFVKKLEPFEKHDQS